MVGEQAAVAADRVLSPVAEPTRIRLATSPAEPMAPRNALIVPRGLPDPTIC